MVTTAFLGIGLLRRGSRGLGPADKVTLVRALCVGGVAALTTGSLMAALLVCELGLLAESFGREVWWLSGPRSLDVVPGHRAAQHGPGRSGAEGVAA